MKKILLLFFTISLFSFANAFTPVKVNLNFSRKTYDINGEKLTPTKMIIKVSTSGEPQFFEREFGESNTINFKETLQYDKKYSLSFSTEEATYRVYYVTNDNRIIAFGYFEHSTYHQDLNEIIVKPILGDVTKVFKSHSNYILKDIQNKDVNIDVYKGNININVPFAKYIYEKELPFKFYYKHSSWSDYLSLMIDEWKFSPVDEALAYKTVYIDSSSITYLYYPLFKINLFSDKKIYAKGKTMIKAVSTPLLINDTKYRIEVNYIQDENFYFN